MKSHKIFKGWVNSLVIIGNQIKIIIFEKNLQTSTLIVKQFFTIGFQNNFDCVETTILSLYRNNTGQRKSVFWHILHRVSRKKMVEDLN